MVFDTVCAVQDFIVPQTLRTPGTLTFSLWGLLELWMVSLGRRGLLDFLGKMVFQPGGCFGGGPTPLRAAVNAGVIKFWRPHAIGAPPAPYYP